MPALSAGVPCSGVDMNASSISLRQLAKVRKRPLHLHCRNLLEKAGQDVHPSTIGAPELMLWTLESKRKDVDQDFDQSFREIVYMIQDKPSLVLSLLEPGDQGDQEEALADILSQQDPSLAGLALLRHLKQRMDSLVDNS
jgi:hypothetical protein